jgi:hypothetical protein
MVVGAKVFLRNNFDTKQRARAQGINDSNKHGRAGHRAQLRAT